MPSNMTQVDPGLQFILLKGEPGTRKSTVALSYLSLGRQYWFSFDRKMNGLLLPMQAWGMNPKDIEFDDYDNWGKAYDQLKKFQLKCPYKTLVIDSITSMADNTLRQIRTVNPNAKKIGGIATDGIEEFNGESAAITDLIAITKDINKFHGVTVIHIAHVVQAEYRNTVANTTHVSRTIVTAGKKVSAKIPAYCSEVYHFNIKQGAAASEKGQYSLLTTHTGDDFARTALPLASEIVFNDKPFYNDWVKPAIEKLKVTSEDSNKKSLIVS